MALQLASPRLRQIQEDVQEQQQRLHQSLPAIVRRQANMRYSIPRRRRRLHRRNSRGVRGYRYRRRRRQSHLPRRRRHRRLALVGDVVAPLQRRRKRRVIRL